MTATEPPLTTPFCQDTRLRDEQRPRAAKGDLHRSREDRAHVPFGPPAGAAVNLTLFSYDGTCHVGINADRAAVTEPVLPLECMQKSLGEVLSFAV